MARPRKNQDYRTPTWHSASARWRLRVGYNLTKNGRRTETDHFWPADEHMGAVCPPHVVAAAVTLQNDWKRVVEQWPDIRKPLEFAEPLIDWSEPVWLPPTQLAAAEDEVRSASRIDLHQVEQQQKEVEDADADAAARWVARHGLQALQERLREPVRPDSHEV